MRVLIVKFPYVELTETEKSGAVQIVNGKPDFSNTPEHFVCKGCNSVFRKIVGTDYFQ